ncbi:MAG TPA: MFS transporter, partial [Xanthobacteraceae bacterium]|nr:MFS transporter [Xanthobacteraceae bacterium]
MRRLPWENFAALTPQMSSEQRRAASVAGVAHALHDGYTDLIYIMLPLWQSEFGLTYAALGVLRSAFVGTMAGLQIPVGLMAEGFGGAMILALGTALAGLGYCLAGLSTGFAMLLGALLVSGIGSSAQHPIASSLVARTFAGPNSLKALGAYNFAGDVGKMTLPATLSLMLLAMTWR